MAVPMIIWVILLAVGLATMTQIINKLVINEKQVDKHREDIKSLQKELKGLDPKSDEFTKKQDALLDKNMWIMKQQFKPMLFTFLPYIIIFYFLSASLAYDPMMVGSSVEVQISGTGDVYSDCLGLDTTVSGKFNDVVEIGSENCTAMLGETELDLALVGEQDIKKFNTDNVKLTITPPEKEYIPLPLSLPLVGSSLGWLGTFILFSFATSLTLTKVLKGKYLRKWE